MPRLRDARRGRGVRGHARPRRRGRHGPGAARDRRDPLHGLRAGGLRAGHRQGAGEVPDASRPASPRRPSSPSTRRRSASSAPPTRCPAIEERLEFPIVVKPVEPGLGARDQVRAQRRGRARGARGGVLLRLEGAARAPRGGPRPGRVDPRRRGAPDRGGRAARRGLLRLRGPLRDRAHRLRLPRRPPRRGDRASARARARHLPAARLPRLRARGPHARVGRRSRPCSRPTRSPA